jgi:hypothetical protein
VIRSLASIAPWDCQGSDPVHAKGGARQSTKDPRRDHPVFGERSSRNRGGFIPKLAGGFRRSQKRRHCRLLVRPGSWPRRAGRHAGLRWSSPSGARGRSPHPPPDAHWERKKEAEAKLSSRLGSRVTKLLHPLPEPPDRPMDRAFPHRAERRKRDETNSRSRTASSAPRSDTHTVAAKAPSWTSSTADRSALRRKQNEAAASENRAPPTRMPWRCLPGATCPRIGSHKSTANEDWLKLRCDTGLDVIMRHLALALRSIGRSADPGPHSAWQKQSATGKAFSARSGRPSAE